MKAYFNIIDFFENSWNNYNFTLKLKSYKIDGVETVTNDFINDTQNIIAHGGDGGDLHYCIVENDGSNPQPYTNIGLSNSFNPFVKCFKTVYPLVNGFPRGLPTGQQNGLNNYGEGVLKFGIDKPFVLMGSNTGVGQDIGNINFIVGCFFLDIDFTKDLNVILEVVSTINEGSPFQEPYVYQIFEIDFNKTKCTKSYKVTYPNNDVVTETGNIIDLSDFGFLAGITKDEYTEGVNPFVDVECHIKNDNCLNRERTISYALFVDIPKEEIEVDTIKECCYNAVVFADDNSNDYEKNDFTGVFHKKQVPSETVEFILVKLDTNEEIPLNNNDYGTFKDFGDITENVNLSTFVLNWKAVLEEKGTGSYTILKRVSIAGINFEQSDINYQLRQYTARAADKTVRIDAVMDGFLQRLGIEFKNSGFKTSLRFGGFFGRRQPKYEEDNIVYTNFESTQISMKQTNEYTLQSNLLPYCMTSQIYDFLLFANDIYLNDYNFNNHIRDFIKFPVKLAESKEIGYNSRTTKAVVNLTFSEKFINNIKRNY